MSEPRNQDWMLSPELEALWEKLDERASSPRRSLSVNAIVTTAIELAQAEGIDAVSMAKVAKQLGFATMAIYRHIPNKAALVVLMIDRAIGAPPVIDAADSSWRETIVTLATAQAAMYRKHAWILSIPVSTPPATPNNLRWMNAMLAALRGTPLSANEKLQSLVLITTYIRGFFQLGAAGDDDTESDEARFFATVERLTRHGGFEDVREVLTALESSTDVIGPDEEFAFGLDRLLDGLAVLFERRSLA